MSDFRQILEKTFLKSPYSPAFWLLLGFIVKVTLFLGVILNHPYHDIPGVWGVAQGDDSSYIMPIDNLFKRGVYDPDFRMPGYGFVYLLFRFFLPQAGACNALLILQVIVASISIYYLALTALTILKKNSVFYLTFYLFLFCSYSNFFDAHIASETFCISFIIFSTYFFSRYFIEHKTRYLFYAGLFATWAMFIRPAFGGLFPLCCFVILFCKGSSFKIKAKHIFLFLIPFMILEGAWVYRNFEAHKKIIPFSSSGGPFYPGAANSYLEPLFYFAQSWGGVCNYTDGSIDADWFQYYYKGMPPITHFDSLPDNIYTSAYNKDSLVRLKRMIIALRSPAIDTVTFSAYQHELRTKLEAYRLSFRREKPFTYFVKAPVKMILVMLYGPETRIYLERGKVVPVFGKLVVFYNNLIYLFIILFGLAGVISLLAVGLKRRSFLLILPLIPLYTILMHPFLFRLHFNRYLMPAFPFLIICSAYIISKIYERYFKQSIKG